MSLVSDRHNGTALSSVNGSLQLVGAESLPPRIELQSPQAQALLGIAVSLPILALISIIARLHAKRLTKRAFGADDLMIVGAFVAILGHAATLVVGIFYAGIATHESLLNPPRLALFLKLQLILQATFALSIGLSQISFCLFLFQIFTIPSFRLAAQLVILYITLSTIFSFLITLLLCNPWSLFKQEVQLPDSGDPAYRSHIFGYLFSSNAFNGITGNILIIFLPLKLVWSNSGLKLGKKAELTVLFGFGVVEIAVGVLRVVTLFHVNPGDVDFTFDVVPMFILGLVEMCLGVAIACVPVIWPVAKARIVRAMYRSRAEQSNERGQITKIPECEIGHRTLMGERISGLSNGRDGCIIIPESTVSTLAPPISTAKMPIMSMTHLDDSSHHRTDRELFTSHTQTTPMIAQSRSRSRPDLHMNPKHNNNNDTEWDSTRRDPAASDTSMKSTMHGTTPSIASLDLSLLRGILSDTEPGAITPPSQQLSNTLFASGTRGRSPSVASLDASLLYEILSDTQQGRTTPSPSVKIVCEGSRANGIHGMDSCGLDLARGCGTSRGRRQGVETEQWGCEDGIEDGIESGPVMRMGTAMGIEMGTALGTAMGMGVGEAKVFFARDSLTRPESSVFGSHGPNIRL